MAMYAPRECHCCGNRAYYNHNIGAWKCWRCGCLTSGRRSTECAFGETWRNRQAQMTADSRCTCTTPPILDPTGNHATACPGASWNR